VDWRRSQAQWPLALLDSLTLRHAAKNGQEGALVKVYRGHVGAFLVVTKVHGATFTVTVTGQGRSRSFTGDARGRRVSDIALAAVRAVGGAVRAHAGHRANRPTRAKARQMLHDRTARGRPLTEKQRHYFGAVASGRAWRNPAPIGPGDRVTFVDPRGQTRTGRVVMPSPGYGWVLNMGGKHGTPAVVSEAMITKVVKARGRNPKSTALPPGFRMIDAPHGLHGWYLVPPARRSNHPVTATNATRRCAGCDYDVPCSGRGMARHKNPKTGRECNPLTPREAAPIWSGLARVSGHLDSAEREVQGLGSTLSRSHVRVVNSVSRRHKTNPLASHKPNCGCWFHRKQRGAR
jgi:hypothetical protein